MNKFLLWLSIVLLAILSVPFFMVCIFPPQELVDWAFDNNNRALLMLLPVTKVNSHGKTALFLAIENQDDDMANFLILRNADVNEQCYAGSLLHLACHRGMEKTVLLLVKHGADVNDQNTPTGLTPLHCVSFSGNTANWKIFMSPNSVEENIK